MRERGLGELEEAVEGARRALEAEDEAREQLLNLTREITRLARQIIFKLHDGDLESAEELLRRASELVDKVHVFKSANPRLYYSGVVASAYVEYVEARMLYCYIKGEKIPSYEELKVEPEHYLLGLADFAGELRRLLLKHLSSGNYDSAKLELTLMEKVYRLLASIAVPDALAPGLRRKVDVLRAVVESSLRDLQYSLTSTTLREAIENLLRELRG